MSTTNVTRQEMIDQLLREFRLMSSFDSLFSHAVAERVGMHQTDIETMDLLNTLGPMTAGELAERTGLTSGATTRLIDRLERAGYVRRRPDANDRRCVIIETVDENLQDLGALFAPVARGTIDLLSRFDDDEVKVILEYVRQSNAMISEFNSRLRKETAEGVARG